MKYLSNKNGFLGIDNKFNFKEKAVIIPFGLEKTVSYGGGTKNGPKEIIKASHQVELYDEELRCEPYKKIGIKTLKEARSWGKVDTTKEQMVFAEATSVLPLIASDAYHKGEWKNRIRKNFTKIFEQNWNISQIKTDF